MCKFNLKPFGVLGNRVKNMTSKQLMSEVLNNSRSIAAKVLRGEKAVIKTKYFGTKTVWLEDGVIKVLLEDYYYGLGNVKVLCTSSRKAIEDDLAYRIMTGELELKTIYFKSKEALVERMKDVIGWFGDKLKRITSLDIRDYCNLFIYLYPSTKFVRPEKDRYYIEQVELISAEADGRKALETKNNLYKTDFGYSEEQCEARRVEMVKEVMRKGNGEVIWLIADDNEVAEQVEEPTATDPTKVKLDIAKTLEKIKAANDLTEEDKAKLTAYLKYYQKGYELVNWMIEDRYPLENIKYDAELEQDFVETVERQLMLYAKDGMFKLDASWFEDKAKDIKNLFQDYLECYKEDPTKFEGTPIDSYMKMDAEDREEFDKGVNMYLEGVFSWNMKKASKILEAVLKKYGYELNVVFSSGYDDNGEPETFEVEVYFYKAQNSEIANSLNINNLVK